LRLNGVEHVVTGARRAARRRQVARDPGQDREDASWVTGSANDAFVGDALTGPAGAARSPARQRPEDRESPPVANHRRPGVSSPCAQQTQLARPFVDRQGKRVHDADEAMMTARSSITEFEDRVNFAICESLNSVWSCTSTVGKTDTAR
jgi:hypothetical protein